MVTGIVHGRRRVPPAGGCPVLLLHVLAGEAEVSQGLALAVPVAGLPPDRQCFLVVAGGLLEPPQLPVDLAEVVQGLALAVPVAGLPEDRQRLLAAAMAFSNRRSLW
jgi:hypothetical protein